MITQNGKTIEALTSVDVDLFDFPVKEGLSRLVRRQPTRVFLDIRPSITGANDSVAVFPVESMSKYIATFLTGVRSCQRSYTLIGEEINSDPLLQTLGISYSP